MPLAWQKDFRNRLPVDERGGLEVPEGNGRHVDSLRQAGDHAVRTGVPPTGQGEGHDARELRPYARLVDLEPTPQGDGPRDAGQAVAATRRLGGEEGVDPADRSEERRV